MQLDVEFKIGIKGQIPHSEEPHKESAGSDTLQVDAHRPTIRRRAGAAGALVRHCN